MSQQKHRNNHYVPEWYQRRFLTDDRKKLFYLNLDPITQLPDGRKIKHREISEFAPSQCFCERDLYTTQFGEAINDEIERSLMGALDTNGAKAVAAIAEGDEIAVHEALQPFFEYLDAQKLRTPKGLDWIRSKYAKLSQVDLMMEMQGLRTMHCTMWAEGVREIISAEDSDVKFIVTDHPVTIYNAAFPPESSTCAYPEDPAIELIGSQTVFVLDENHCLILTNLEYSKNPDDANLTAKRTNARYRGHSIVRTDAYIRTRKFTREEVIAVNYLLKNRARKYIASSNKDWLYPENEFKGDWKSIAKILLPRDELYRFGGEIYVGYKDGSVHYQDEFGRTSGAHEYLRKPRKESIDANDNCGCGSGRKFKKCCQGKSEQDRPSWEVFSIRERNLMFIRAVQDMLGLNKGKSWEDVRRDLSDDQVKEIHEMYGSLWPKDTDIASLLPRPDPNLSRGVFLGTVDPRTVGANAIGMLTYFDEIILPNPFVNPGFVKPDYSPTHSPAQHKEQTVKNIVFLLTLEPFIHAGLIHLVPDPTDFNDEFRRRVWAMVEQRTGDWKPGDTDFDQLRFLAEEDFQRTVRRMPESSLKAYIRRLTPEIEDGMLDKVVVEMKKQAEEDPFALLQAMQPGKENAQFKIIKGFNLEIALFIAGLTGSFVYTDMNVHWRHLHEHTIAGAPQATASWKPVTAEIKSIMFPLPNPDKVLDDRVSVGYGGSVRSLIRRILGSMLSNGPAKLTPMVTALGGHIARLQQNHIAEALLEANFEFSVPPAGFENNAVRRLIVTFGRANDIRIAPIAMLVQIYRATNKIEGTN